MRNANGIKKGISVKVDQDVSLLSDAELRTLRKKADALSIAPLLARIDAERTHRRERQGRGLSDRERAWVALCGSLPTQRPGRDEHAVEIGGKLLIEVERGLMRPATKVEAERGVKWVHELPRAKAQAMGALGSPLFALFFALLDEHREREVVAVLFNERGARDYAPLPSLRGQVAKLERSSGAFKIEFSTKEK